MSLPSTRFRITWLALIFLAACNPPPLDGGDDAGLVLGTLPTLDADAGGQSIAGQVTLVGGGAAAGATVLLEPGDLTAETDSTGSFLFASVSVGTFAVSATLAGYAPQSTTTEVAAGQDQAILFTLERSELLLPLAASSNDGGGGVPFLGYPQWVALVDGGRAPGAGFFAGIGDGVWTLVGEGGDGGVVSAFNAGNASTDVPAFIGFDRGGRAVWQLDAGALFVQADGTATLLTGVSNGVVVGDDVFFSEPQPFSTARNWFAEQPGDVAPTPIAQGIAATPAPTVLSGGLVGWSNSSCEVPVLFAPALSFPTFEGCAAVATPLTSSLDGDRIAFWGAAGNGDAQVVIVGDSFQILPPPSTLSSGDSLLSAPYPLSASTYLVSAADDAGTEWLDVVGPAGSDAGQSLAIAGWAPMHGDDALILTATGELTHLDGQTAIPFPATWSSPMLSASNRYVVFADNPTLFDLQTGLAAPLTLLPQNVAFDRAEAHALLADAQGNLAVVALGALSGNTPQGVPLEGIARAASFDASETSVVYVGTDPLGNLGLFREALP